MREETECRRGGEEWTAAYRIGGIAAFLLMIYCLATMVQIAVLGGPPASAAEAFRLLQANRIVGMLRLDLGTTLAMPLYYLLFFSLYMALRWEDRVKATLGTVLGFAGLTLFLAAPAALSMASLSDKYAAAATEAARAQWLAAGEAVTATDLWHGSAAMTGGVLMQAGAVLICAAMLRGHVFGKATAWIGVAMYGLDLAHIFGMIFLPVAGVVLMAMAGPLYPVWFWLVGRRLLRLAAEGAPWQAAAATPARG